MKKIIIVLIFLSGLGILLNSCKKEEKSPVLNIAESSPATITSPTDGYSQVLTIEDSASMITFSWDAATIKVDDGVTLPTTNYQLEMDFADNNFAAPVELSLTSETTYSIMLYNFNSKLITMGLTGDSTAAVAFRVTTKISGADYFSLESSVVSATYTTFAPATPPPPAETPKLWVPGDYQGWDPAGAPNVYYDEELEAYTGYVYYPEGGTYEFKFTSAPDWDHTNFGAGASEGLLDKDSGAGNLSVPEFGYYYLTCDTVNLTWSYEAQSWGVIGSGILAGDWSEDVNLEWDAVNGYLSVTIDVSESSDENGLRFKFRANDAWDLNLGLGENEGELSPGGDDIPMPEGAGNYTFILDMSGEIPTYQLIKN